MKVSDEKLGQWAEHARFEDCGSMAKELLAARKVIKACKAVSIDGGSDTQLFFDFVDTLDEYVKITGEV